MAHFLVFHSFDLTQTFCFVSYWNSYLNIIFAAAAAGVGATVAVVTPSSKFNISTMCQRNRVACVKRSLTKVASLLAVAGCLAHTAEPA